MSFPWRKSWSKLNLASDSPLRQVLPDERSLAHDFYDLANISPVRGTVCVAEGIPYTQQQLAAILRCPLELIERGLPRLADVHLIEICEGVIHVVDWAKYQSESARVMASRRKHTARTTHKVTGEVTQKVTAEIAPVDSRLKRGDVDRDFRPRPEKKSKSGNTPPTAPHDVDQHRNNGKAKTKPLPPELASLMQQYRDGLAQRVEHPIVHERAAARVFNELLTDGRQSVEEVRQALERFFGLKDRFIVERGFQLSDFYARFNALKSGSGSCSSTPRSTEPPAKYREFYVNDMEAAIG